MNLPINIHNSNVIIELPYGIYSVKVLGGFGIEVGNFSFQLKNIVNGDIVKPKETQWRVQSYMFKKRAKKIFTIDIQKGGKFVVEFTNQNDLKVRKSNLFLSRLYDKQISNKDLEIYIG